MIHMNHDTYEFMIVQYVIIHKGYKDLTHGTAASAANLSTFSNSLALTSSSRDAWFMFIPHATAGHLHRHDQDLVIKQWRYRLQVHPCTVQLSVISFCTGLDITAYINKNTPLLRVYLRISPFMWGINEVGIRIKLGQIDDKIAKAFWRPQEVSYIIMKVYHYILIIYISPKPNNCIASNNQIKWLAPNIQAETNLTGYFFCPMDARTWAWMHSRQNVCPQPQNVYAVSPALTSRHIPQW